LSKLSICTCNLAVSVVGLLTSRPVLDEYLVLTRTNKKDSQMKSL